MTEYFSHDSNARSDPKIMALLQKYGMEGYGRWWVIIETLREQNGYKLKQCQWVINGIAMAMLCDANSTNQFINDCITEFELLESDGEHFWSNSLIKRMKKMEESREKRSRAGRKGAAKRWKNGKAITMPKQRNDKAMAKDNIVIAKDGNKIKRKETNKDTLSNKRSYAEYVLLTEEEYSKLIDKYGKEDTLRMIEILDNYKGANGKKYKSDYRAILNWVVDRLMENKEKERRKKFNGNYKQGYSGKASGADQPTKPDYSVYDKI